MTADGVTARWRAISSPANCRVRGQGHSHRHRWRRALYRVTTNAVICEGIGAALALETGVATLGNMEAVQFHPTAFSPPASWSPKGVAAMADCCVDVDGHRFMPDYEPRRRSWPRATWSRGAWSNTSVPARVKSRFGEHLWLDIRLLGAKHIETNLREVKEICEYFLGIDPITQMIPVRPAQHYTMGGVRTDHTGRARRSRACFPPARRPAGTCTGSTGWAAIPSPKPSWPA